MSTSFDQPAIDFDAVSAPIAGETKATVELVANDWRADRDWRIFENACRLVARINKGVVDPNLVRAELTDSTWGELVIEARRYSSFWSRAASKTGFLVKSGWTMNDDVKSGNRGKPTRTYSLRSVEAMAS